MQKKEAKKGSIGLPDVLEDEVRSRIDHRTGKRIYLHDATFWAGHVDRWRRSGETVEGYCKRHGFGRSTFRRWAQRLEDRNPRRAGSARVAGEDGVGAGATKFLAVPIRQDGQRSSAGQMIRGKASSGQENSQVSVEVWLDASVRVVLSGEAAAQAVASVLARLEATTR